jgi:hypothetical protein
MKGVSTAGGKEASSVSPGRTLSSAGKVSPMTGPDKSNRSGLKFGTKRISNRGPQSDSGFSQVKKNGKGSK